MTTQQKQLLAVIGGLVVLAAGIGILRVTRHQPLAVQAPASAAVYYCPMHPTYTSDKPGDCPICNMRLVKKEPEAAAATPAARAAKQMKDICLMHNCPMEREGKPCPMLMVAKEGEEVHCPVCGTHVTEAASTPPGSVDGYAKVVLTPEKRRMIGMATAPVERRALTKTIRTVGTVAHDPELYQAQEEFIRAHHAWQRAQQGHTPEIAEQAQRLVESSRLRLRHLGLSAEMIEAIGTWTEPDHRLLLGGEGQFWVYASIYEYELPFIKPEQRVAIEVNAFPGRRFDGVVKAIDPMLDAATRTARARILVSDPDGALKPGMYVNVLVTVPVEEALAVPEDAVFHTGTREIVFVDQGDGVFEPRDVTLGAKADRFYEVKGGLAAGERVVTNGNFLIDSESRLKASMDAAAGGGHQHGP